MYSSVTEGWPRKKGDAGISTQGNARLDANKCLQEEVYIL